MYYHTFPSQHNYHHLQKSYTFDVIIDVEMKSGETERESFWQVCTLYAIIAFRYILLYLGIDLKEKGVCYNNTSFDHSEKLLLNWRIFTKTYSTNKTLNKCELNRCIEE